MEISIARGMFRPGSVISSATEATSPIPAYETKTKAVAVAIPPIPRVTNGVYCTESEGTTPPTT